MDVFAFKEKSRNPPGSTVVLYDDGDLNNLRCEVSSDDVQLLENFLEQTDERERDGDQVVGLVVLWMVGRYKQLDEGAGRQIWKCHDPLNCATVAASCAALHIM